MPDTPLPPASIILWGPPTIDWLNVRHGQEGQVERDKQEVFLSAQPGGVALLHKLLEEMKGSTNTRIVCNRIVRDLLDRLKPNARGELDQPPSPLEKRFRHTWSLWENRGKPEAYRMTPEGVSNWEREVPSNAAFKEWDDVTSAERSLLILDDPGLSEKSWDTWDTRGQDFRDLADLVKRANTSDVILRMDSRSAERGEKPTDSALFRDIPNEIAKKTILLTSVRSLRANEVRVGQSLSWERLFEDVIRAAEAKLFQKRDGNAPFERAIITTGLAGAVLIDRTQSPHQYSLVFDRERQEDDLEADRRGKVLGSSTCMLAALATAWEQKKWKESPKDGREENRRNPLLYAVRRGVEMTRTLAYRGYRPSRRPVERQVLEFPINALRREYHERELDEESKELQTFTRASPGGQAVEPQTWTILASSFQDPNDQLEKAKRIVLEGVSALKHVPIGKVNDWYSADRSEIEGVRSVQNAIRDYLSNKSQTKPLSIAVFGPPGSGKSFVVDQIATVLGIAGSRVDVNLSQYESAAELAKAFHQIQGILLGGKEPLVFWDEFDTSLETQPLGWLRYFLAPMQDAKFADQGQLHPVGRGIYIFAGGTYASFKAFAAEPTPEEKAAKKPDFVSRLRAYIDVKGPNRADTRPAWWLTLGDGLASRSPAASPVNESDEFYMIRRAFLLRGSLLKHAKGLKNRNDGLSIDPGVLNAFLQARRYKHGSRSLDSIVAVSSLKGKAKYEVSSLPPEHLLEMHIDDVEQFMQLARVQSANT